MFGGIGFAAAQQTSGDTHPQLTSNQQQTIGQGLSSSPSQPAPAGQQPQVGSRVPDSMTAQNLPDNVTDQVPAAKKLLFVKLPDRILLIDPDTQMVAQIVTDSTTTGSNTGAGQSGASQPGASQPSNCGPGTGRDC
jgi:hypothetical protein